MTSDTCAEVRSPQSTSCLSGSCHAWLVNAVGSQDGTSASDVSPSSDWKRCGASGCPPHCPPKITVTHYGCEMKRERREEGKLSIPMQQHYSSMAAFPFTKKGFMTSDHNNVP